VSSFLPAYEHSLESFIVQHGLVGPPFPKQQETPPVQTSSCLAEYQFLNLLLFLVVPVLLFLKLLLSIGKTSQKLIRFYTTGMSRMMEISRWIFTSVPSSSALSSGPIEFALLLADKGNILKARRICVIEGTPYPLYVRPEVTL
jgi:hypothetical protein